LTLPSTALPLPSQDLGGTAPPPPRAIVVIAPPPPPPSPPRCPPPPPPPPPPGGGDQYACTSPYVEGYRGVSGAKNTFLPQKSSEKSPQPLPTSSQSRSTDVLVGTKKLPPQQNPTQST
jgi:hypothetical protein